MTVDDLATRRRHWMRLFNAFDIMLYLFNLDSIARFMLEEVGG